MYLQPADAANILKVINCISFKLVFDMVKMAEMKWQSWTICMANTGKYCKLIVYIGRTSCTTSSHTQLFLITDILGGMNTEIKHSDALI